MKRRELRENVFYVIFQLYFAGQEDREDVLRVFFEQFEIDEKNKEFITEEVKGIMEHSKELDDLVEAYSKGWKLSRMSKVDRAILRVALYEMKYMESVPIGVAINEAVEISKKFSTEESPTFINGILGSIAKSEF